MKSIYQLMGKKIRASRKMLELTQADLAEKAGISINYTGHIERGTKKASLETILRIANALEIPVSELFNESEGYEPAREDLFSKKILFLIKDKKTYEKENILKVIRLISRKK